MSTEFYTELDEGTQFVRYAGRNGVSYEFGTVSNYERVRSFLEAGQVFEPLGASDMQTDPQTPADLDQLVAEERATFGEYPVTVAVGSGEMFRFGVEE